MPELHDVLLRFWSDLLSRPNGPYGFRFFLQPMTAMIIAVIDGIADARSGRTPYLLHIFRNRHERISHLHDGIKATARIMLLGMAMEVLYQVKVLHTFYVVEAIIIVFFLAFLPYLLMRGPAARIARRHIKRKDRK